MPWQQYVADVALELDPITGGFAYDEVGLTVPRQSGKSTLLLSKAVHRCSATRFFGGRQRVVYTAQTRQKAREKWREDYVADLESSRTFSPRITPYYGGGDEHIRFANGSKFGIESNTEKAGHGGTIDEAYIDEAFAQVDNRLEQAFSPAMITRRNTQLWWVSTAGWTGESLFLEPRVQRGRDHVAMGLRDGLAYFEWSLAEDADPEDPAGWWTCMPALGYTITEDAIAREFRKMSDRISEFRRAYLNQWVVKGAELSGAVVDMTAWADLVDVEDVRPSPVALSVEVSPDRRWSSIGLAGVRSDGKRHVQVVESGRGTGWVADRAAELAADHNAVGVGVDSTGPGGSLIPDLQDRKVPLVIMSTRDVARACGMFVDGVTEATIHHQGQDLLSVSLEAARKRRTGESWVWSVPTGAKTDIAPLKAVTLALFVLASNKPPERKPSRVIVMR